LVQLLSNLLENASKYTPAGTRITITALREGTRLRLSVEDNGPGWGDRDPERLFEKFSRGNAESSAVGVGLGLSICRVIARLHGGEIRASSAPQGGARFEIDLPAAMEDVRLEATACEA
jgi:two-component system sensor histidine kinase KdpD